MAFSFHLKLKFVSYKLTDTQPLFKTDPHIHYNMIIGCYPRSECMIKTYYKKSTPDGIKFRHTLDGAKVNVSCQIFRLGLFYKFIVQDKNIHV